MDKARTTHLIRKLPRNILATAGTQAILVCSNLLLVPMYLRCWSGDLYGEWLTLSSVAAYLAAADFGMSTATVNELSMRFSLGQTERFRRIFDTAFCAYVILACGASILGWCLFRFVPFALLGIRIEATEASAVAALLVAQIAFSFPLTLVLSFHRAVGNYHRSQWLLNLHRFLLAGLTGAALLLGADLLHVAWVQLAVALVMIGGTLLAVKITHPHLAPSFRHASLTEASGLLRSGCPFAVMMIGNTISQQGPVLIISTMLGPWYVTAYSTIRTLANSIRQVVGIIGVAAWPELTIAQAEASRDVARNIHRMVVGFSVCMATTAGGTLWFLGPQITKWWTHTELPFATELVRCFAVQLVLQTPWLASSVVSLSANKNRILSWLYVSSAGAGVVLGALTIRAFGVPAVPISLMIAEVCICSHFVVKDSCVRLGEDYRPFAIRLWTRLPLLIIAALATAAFTSRVFPSSVIVRSLITAVSTTIAVCATGGAVWLHSSEREKIVQKLAAVAGALGSERLKISLGR